MFKVSYVVNSLFMKTGILVIYSSNSTKVRLRDTTSALIVAPKRGSNSTKIRLRVLNSI